MKPHLRKISRNRHRFDPLVVLAGLAALVAWPASVARGQLTSDLANLRSRDSFTDADRRKIGTAVDATLQKIAEAESDDDRRKLAREFRNIWGDLSSLNFKDELAGILSTRIAGRVANDPGEAMMIVLQNLRGWKHDRTIGAMRAGLKHKAAAVRLIAGQGIQDLWGSLPSGEVQPTIEALQQAGVSETDWIVCRQICAALATAGNSPAVINALLETLDARVKDYTKHGGAGAEIALLSFLQSQLDGLNPETRIRIVKNLALLLAQVIPQYIQDVEAAAREEIPREQLINTQVLIEVAERLLTDLVREDVERIPNIRQELKKGLPDGLEGIQVELNNWIGTSEQQGALNKAPYSVPVGGGVPPKAPDQEKPAANKTEAGG